MNALELRKQLLIAESDLNRDQLTREMAAIKSAHRNHHGSSAKSIATSAAAGVLNLAAIPHGKKTAAGSKQSWLQNTLKGATLVSTIWLAVLARRDN